MKTCAVCNEPVIFLPLVGWAHMTFQEFDHEARVK